ncbi:MAG: hypothetical protein JWO46_2443 [Nocardioidaceae bacterium]|nr:hypothetical protein [Nocardioidaceae bacterium]
MTSTSTRRKAGPTPRQVDALGRQRAHGDDLRGWLQGRAASLAKSIRERLKRKPKTKARSRGVDRVPARYRVAHPVPVVIASPEGPNHAERRARSQVHGQTPRRNLDPVRARLVDPQLKAKERAEQEALVSPMAVAPLGVPRTRRGERGGVQRINAAGGDNTPHRNPARAAKLARNGTLRKDLP